MEFRCLECNDSFESYDTTRKYCSKSCSNRANCRNGSIGLKGRSFSEEHRRKLSESHKGKILPREQVEKIANANRGKRRSPEFCKNLSESLMGHIAYNKGKPMSDQQKEKIRLAMTGKRGTPESRLNMRLARLAVLKRCEFSGGQVSPAYNPIACKFFDWFDHEFQTTGQYATKGGEFFIEDLGYLVDYFNPEMGIIIEWDEERVHYRNGQLREKDILRQEEIMRHFPRFELLRVREKCFDILQLAEVA